MDFLQSIHQKFLSLYGQQPLFVRSPARINLIGEHTDYNYGYVLPAAIDKELLFAVAPNKVNQFRIFAYNFDDYVLIENQPLVPQTNKNKWTNYLMGVVVQLQKLGFTVPTFDCVFGGNIPKGAGLSSSAAVECGLALALNTIFDFKLSKLDLVKISQKAENEFVGVQCGIMDQFANTFGLKDQVILLDCKNLDYQLFPLQLNDYQLILLDTDVHHSLASSEYNTRRKQCEAGVNILKKYEPYVNSLRDVNRETLEKYKKEFDYTIWKRCDYVVKENERVLAVCQSLKNADIEDVGRKMFASHLGLQYDYEVSCPELDFLVTFAANDGSVVGSRMMGGGFGGCTINIVRKEKAKSFIQRATYAYAQHNGKKLKAYPIKIADGTSICEN
ncbi:MAG: galactokinase [Cytophagales bacterium]|nr:MAG: galactokinase [Cytophagales bacterium]